MTARTHATIFLAPNDQPKALTSFLGDGTRTSSNVWVHLDHSDATGTASAVVFPYSSEQADALAAAFTEAARIMREAGA